MNVTDIVNVTTVDDVWNTGVWNTSIWNTSDITVFDIFNGSSPTSISTTGLGSSITQNITTSIPDSNMSLNAACNSSLSNLDHSQMDAFLYIVVVISCYAICMIILMVKYIRREEEEVQLEFDFYEFITREKFHAATYQNRQNVRIVRKMLATQYHPVMKESTV